MERFYNSLLCWHLLKRSALWWKVHNPSHLWKKMEQSQESLVFQNHRTQGKHQRGPEKFRHLIKIKTKITLPPKSLHKNPTIFGTQTGHHQDCRETERIYCENFFFIKRKPACAFQPIPSLALWAPFCCSWSFLLKHNGHLFSILFIIIAMHFSVDE